MAQLNPASSSNQSTNVSIESERSNFSYIISPIELGETLPDSLPSPKFHISEMVMWSKVESQGYGEIIGLVFSSGVSVRATGFHYLILFAADNSSRNDCIADWGFEDDLERFEAHAHTLTNSLCSEGSDVSKR
jgi:hypothetical protein